MDPLIYQYTVGGLVFIIGVIYAARQGYVGFTGRGLRNLLILVGGLAVFVGVQGYLQYAPMATADEVPYAGGYEYKQTLGTPLDYGIVIAYFLAILAIGTWFGRNQRTSKDFFFGGQRFSWWLIAFSLLATTVGSYSFVKYSQVAYKYGLSSSQTYLNDWLWVPLLIFGWLPILYFSRITSIPEYFERRFGRSVRNWATIFLLVYLVGYVGVNLFTMGKVFNILLNWDIFWSAVIVAGVSACYVTVGGQTSVIMTDLFQGVMLMVVGLLLLVLGIDYLGGFDLFWQHLPRGHRTAFSGFNSDPSFPAVGIFWQDAMANSAMFYFLNQGMVMRFMAARSVGQARRAAIFTPLILMPLAACVVASGGWVGKALVHAGVLPPDIKASEAFFVSAEFLSRPGVFGLILAALTAALMSTVDTLITAVSAVVVNDYYKPYVRPDAREDQLLRVARLSAVGVAVLGVALVPVFMMFKTIYEAHGAFTAAVTPPMVVTLLLSVFWRRFTKTAALATLVGGMAAIVFSLFVPQVIGPFAHGVKMVDAGDGFFAGAQQFKFMRAFYGLVVSGVIAVVVTLFTRPEPFEKCRGLVWGTIADAIKHYKGGAAGRERAGARVLAVASTYDDDALHPKLGLPKVCISRGVAEPLGIGVGDLVHVSDRRRWLGGLRSTHAVVADIIADGEASHIQVGPSTAKMVGLNRRPTEPLSIEAIC
ncbi:MAG: sodium:solute symporter family protein [Phycisphaerae bacterium]|nr:sodium:solute symporter family protein [Phycisphaerae bacterium]